MCNSGDCPYEHPITGECELECTGELYWHGHYPEDAACMQREADFKRTTIFLKGEPREE